MPRFVKPDRSAAIGARLCIARVTAGLSRVDLARALDLSAAQVEKYERGRARLPAVMLVDLARLLLCSPLFFVETDDTALARTLLLQLPDGTVPRRQIDRAVTALKRAGREGAPADAAAGDRVSA